MSNDDRVLEFIDGQDDPIIADRIRASYASVPAASEQQIAACRNAVLAAPAGRRRILGISNRWWWSGAAAAALLIVVTLRPVKLDDGSRRSVDSATADSVSPVGSTEVVRGGLAVRFDLRLPAGARGVALVGDFNGWDSTATPMAKRGADGTWTAELPLVPGVHTYAFVVDGERWLVDPLAPQVPDEGFGPANAVVVGSE
jgi:hypothetical protein